ncbi:glycosyltransferase [bacterium]|nr:glycosyltransferase [bacterium]
MSRPIRVLHVIDSWNLGGAQTVLLNLLRHGDQSAFEYSAFSLHGPGTVEGEAGEIVDRCGHFATSKADPRLVWRFLRAVRDWKPDIVHAHLVASCFLAEVLLPFYPAKTRLVSHMQSIYRPPDHEEQYQNFLERFIYRRSHRIIACSRPTLDSLEKARGRKVKQASVIFNSVPDAIITGRIPEDRIAIRNELGASEDATVVLTACRLSPTKNLLFGVEVMARLQETHPDLQWWIAGEGAEGEALRRAVKDANLRGVQFLGYRNDVPKLLSAADYFLMPSLYEGLSLALAEALAKEAVPVVTPFEGFDQMIEHEKTGVVIPFRDADKAAELWRAILDNEGQRASLAAEGLVIAKERFSASKMAADIEELYRDVIA